MTQKEVTIGALFLVISVATTCVFESSLIRSIKSFEEGRSAAVSLSSPQVSTSAEDQLVHFSGLITTTLLDGISQNVDELQLRHSPYVLDPKFGIIVKGVKLHRHVEMLQWVETSYTSTSSTPEDEDRRFDDDRERIYMYDLSWKEEVVDSSTFHDISYRNPPLEAWKYKSMVMNTKNLVIGEFLLPQELVDQIQRRDVVHLDTSSRQKMTNLLDRRIGTTWATESALNNITVEGDFFYFRSETRDPTLGDQRVFFEVTPNYPVTVCAKQKGKDLVPYITSTGDSLYLLEDGIMTANELFDKKSHDEVRKTRFYRLFAAVLGFMGFLVLRRSLIERFGSVLGGIQQHLLACTLSIALTSLVVGANWLLYRPLWAIMLSLCGWTPLIGLFIVFRPKHGHKTQ
ncbi:Transmembrane protein 43 family [Plasmopara halstedii]|uniref:Transmembrane protein 43 family n=1 Tax=Plasmopara halstedii TaxID=4781 RepID=A0A0P1AMN7_PLAHL|nr:Transmembrane protein 43 family [Plasmopara halstedii]CEG42653.1 Transmembrane protein 43 family [Plasmopara halstedii]|eukprot:XP_024579022.1 Transmembrane protein 43 family [Plasmopara halstedii]